MNDDETLSNSSRKCLMDETVREYGEIGGRNSCLVTPMKLSYSLDILNVPAARIVLGVIPKKVYGIGICGQRMEDQ